MERDGRPVELHRKGLALLAYLGVSGSASRDHLAALLWDSWAGRTNLRVELHRLTEAVGEPLFRAGEDPLRLPAWVSVDGEPSAGELLAGLNDVSSAFDFWLQTQRAQQGRAAPGDYRASALARHLAAGLEQPFLVVVRVRPVDDVSAFTSALGAATGLPVIEGCGGPPRAVHVLNPPYSHPCIQAVLDAKDGAYVVSVPAYGEDSLPVLALRSRVPAARTRFVELPPVPWREARAGVLAGLPFSLAAESYLWSGGNAGFLAELASMKWARERDGRLAVPQRVRAAYQFEMRHASMRTRLALERLSVHPGRLSDGLIRCLGADEALDELERRGWLAYDEGWHFQNAESRVVLYRSLQAGRRAKYHRAAANQLASEGRWPAAVFHRLRAGDAVTCTDADPLVGPQGDAIRAWLGLPLAGSSPLSTRFEVGRELALLEAARQGSEITGDGAEWTLVRASGRPAAAVRFELPRGRLLLHVSGRAWVDGLVGGGLERDAVILQVEMGLEARLVFLPGLDSPLARDGLLYLPLSDHLDTWVLVPPGVGEVTVFSNADAAVLELELTVHEAIRAGERPASTRRVVTAIDVAGGPAQRSLFDGLVA